MLYYSRYQMVYWLSHIILYSLFYSPQRVPMWSLLSFMIVFSLTPYSSWNYLFIHSSKNTRSRLWKYGEFSPSPNITRRNVIVALNFFLSWNNGSFGKCNNTISSQWTNTMWHVWNSRGAYNYLAFISYIVPHFILYTLFWIVLTYLY